MEFVLKEVEEYSTIPDGEIVRAEVAKCEERESIFDDDNNPGVKKREVSFMFTIMEGEYVGRKVFGSTPTTFTTHPDCKLRVWVQELLGEDSLPSGFRFNTTMLEGLPCRLVVGAREGRPAHAGAAPKIKNYASDVMRDRVGAPSASEIF